MEDRFLKAAFEQFISAQNSDKMQLITKELFLCGSNPILQFQLALLPNRFQLAL